MKKYKKRKLLLAAGGICTVLVVVILAVFLYQPKEIDQKVLFIYRQCNGGGGYISADEGYYIDNHGNKVEYDLMPILDSRDFHRDVYKLLEILNQLEVTESTPVFSAGKTAKLYHDLYQIDAERELEREWANSLIGGEFILWAVRYKENGEPEIIELFEAGDFYAENQDPYAQKIKTALLRENPIWVHW